MISKLVLLTNILYSFKSLSEILKRSWNRVCNRKNSSQFDPLATTLGEKKKKSFAFMSLSCNSKWDGSHSPLNAFCVSNKWSYTLSASLFCNKSRAEPIWTRWQLQHSLFTNPGDRIVCVYVHAYSTFIKWSYKAKMFKLLLFIDLQNNNYTKRTRTGFKKQTKFTEARCHLVFKKANCNPHKCNIHFWKS